MQKWIMGGLFFAACLVAVVLMFSLPGEEPVAQEEKPAMPQVTLDAAAAESIVQASCLSCHGDQLQGGFGPALDNAGTTHTAEELYSIIAKGKGQMPAFQDQLSEEEIANVSLWLAEKK